MLRRFSSTFKKSSKSDRDAKPNGTQVNGQKRQSKVPTAHESSSDEGRSDRGDRSEKSDDGLPAFEKYAQVLHASRRPLPNQTGDGTYLEHEHSSSMFQDLRSLGFKDVGTLKDLLKTKAKGEYVDDKTMLMERIIQVRLLGCYLNYAQMLMGTSSPACQQPSRKFEDPRRPHKCLFG